MTKGRMSQPKDGDVIDIVEYKIETPYSKGFYVHIEVHTAFNDEICAYEEKEYIAYLCHKDRYEKDFISYVPVKYKGIYHTYKDFEESIPRLIDDAISRYIENHFTPVFDE